MAVGAISTVDAGSAEVGPEVVATAVDDMGLVGAATGRWGVVRGAAAGARGVGAGGCGTSTGDRGGSATFDGILFGIFSDACGSPAAAYRCGGVAYTGDSCVAYATHAQSKDHSNEHGITHSHTVRHSAGRRYGTGR